MNPNENGACCPLCGKKYSLPPAISRKDNQTPICPDCGTREALRVLRLPEKRIEAILAQIHEQTKEITHE